MKKLFALALAVVLALSLAACGTKETGETISGALPEIVDRLYDKVDVDDETREFLKTGLMTTDIPAENLEYFFGVSDVDFEEAVASEPMINAKAFSVCLMRVSDGTDIEALKAEIREKANPNKWICVGVDPGDVRVESVGNLILLIMAENSEKYSEAFYALAE
ncbi:MAG: hypothetical protein ACI4GO_03440 [Hominenteromicrobium sp.]